MSSMRDHQGIIWRRFVGPRPKWGKTTLITLWSDPSTSSRSIFITLRDSRSKLMRLNLTWSWLWGMLRVGVYLILLGLLALGALLFLHLVALRFSPHSTPLPFSMRGSGLTDQ